MTLNYKAKKILIMFLFCFFIYPPMLKASGMLSYAVIYGVPAACLLLNHHLFSKITIKQFSMIGLAILLVVLSFVYPTLHGTGDFTYVRTATYIFRKLIIFLFLNVVLIKEYKEECSVETFMYYYAWTQASYVIGTLILVALPSIRSLWFSIFNEVIDSEQYLQSFGYTFRIGWQGFSGYRLTLHCSISCIFLFYLYFVGGRQGRLKTSKFLVPYILCFAGNMFYGRSGLVITIISSLLALLIWNRANLKRVAVYLGIIVMVFFVLYQLRNVSLFSNWYYWMTTPIKNLITTGSFNNISFTTTKEMVFVPEFKTVLLGDGFYTSEGHYYMRTDSGIMRNILFWGILGAIISYGMTVSLIFDTKNKNWLLCLLLLGCFVAFEFKGDVYYEFSALFLGLSFIETMRKKYLSSNTRGASSQKSNYSRIKSG